MQSVPSSMMHESRLDILGGSGLKTFKTLHEIPIPMRKASCEFQLENNHVGRGDVRVLHVADEFSIGPKTAAHVSVHGDAHLVIEIIDVGLAIVGHVHLWPGAHVKHELQEPFNGSAILGSV